MVVEKISFASKSLKTIGSDGSRCTGVCRREGRVTQVVLIVSQGFASKRNTYFESMVPSFSSTSTDKCDTMAKLLAKLLTSTGREFGTTIKFNASTGEEYFDLHVVPSHVVCFAPPSLFFRYQQLRACLHEGGGPQVGEVTCGRLPHLTCKRDHIKMRDYMDRRATPPKRVTSPIWGTPTPCKQALRVGS